MTSAARQPSFLATRRGKLTLALLCALAFLDFVDASIVNVALPDIRKDLDFSVQGLQWVPSGYLLTYGGFMLLGGRVADLLGRRSVLVAGTVLIGVSSLVGGFADDAGVLIGARLRPCHCGSCVRCTVSVTCSKPFCLRSLQSQVPEPRCARSVGHAQGARGSLGRSPNARHRWDAAVG